MLNLFLLFSGFILLIKGADFLIKGATSFAYKFGISKMVIGLTIVAIGTSLPEFSVSVFSAVRGQGGLLFGNIVGSNIANILLILGLSALASPLVFKDKTVKKEIPILIVSAFILIFLLTFFNEARVLDLWQGAVLLVLFLAFIFYLTRTNRFSVETAEEYLDKMSRTRSVLLIALGAIGLVAGAELIVVGASALAKIFGVTEGVIGLVVVAIGTSLPELATSIVAAKKHDYEIVIGNVIGSNIINILLILGFSALINPIAVSDRLLAALFFYAVTAILLYLLLIFNKYKINKYYASALVALYVIYIFLNMR